MSSTHAPAVEVTTGTTHAANTNQYQLPSEIPNIASLIEAVAAPHHEPGVRAKPIEEFHIGHVPVPINPLFSIFYAIVIVFVIRRALKSASIRNPGRMQNMVEALLGGLQNFFTDLLGKDGRKYIPYVGSLFLFIWVNNLMCLVPFFKAPTSSLKTTVALGLCTFAYVHYSVIRDSGFKSWFMHLMGEPLWLAPLNFPLHILSELIKPVSLSARLFGNILGEDKLLAAFLGIGMMITAAISGSPTPIVGVPLQVIPFFLVIIGSTIQATVFAALASVYIVMLLPHHEADAEQKHATGASSGPI